jgi:hypothetical protein
LLLASSVKPPSCNAVGSPSTIVTNVTEELGYRLYERGIGVSFAKEAEILRFSETSSLSLVPNQPPIHSVRGFFPWR